MRVSTAEPDHKEKLTKRIPANLPTIERLCELNRADWQELRSASGKRAEALREQMATRRRRIAALIEELGREYVPTVMLYGRVVEHVTISEAEFQAVLQTLGVGGDPKAIIREKLEALM